MVRGYSPNTRGHAFGSAFGSRGSGAARLGNAVGTASPGLLGIQFPSIGNSGGTGAAIWSGSPGFGTPTPGEPVRGQATTVPTLASPTNTTDARTAAVSFSFAVRRT